MLALLGLASACAPPHEDHASEAEELDEGALAEPAARTALRLPASAWETVCQGSHEVRLRGCAHVEAEDASPFE